MLLLDFLHSCLLYILILPKLSWIFFFQYLTAPYAFWRAWGSGFAWYVCWCWYGRSETLTFLDQFSICWKKYCICSPVCTTRWHRRILSQALRVAYAGGHETWCTHSVARCCGALQLDLGPPDAETGRFASAASAGLWNQRWGHALEAGQGGCTNDVSWKCTICTKLVSICLDASWTWFSW